MTIPNSSDIAWSDIITGKTRHEFECLALKILLGRLRLNSEGDPSKVQTCANELREFFIKNPQLPSAQRDLKKIFGDA